jgi:methionyl aminopeptidase
MIYLKTEEQIELLREANLVVARTLGEVAKWVKPGVTTLKLDQIAEEYIRSQGAVPGFLGLYGFPNTLCISVNENVVHGIPSNYALQEGDIVSVDCGAVKDGFNGDSAYTFCVGEVSPEVKALLKTTKESLYVGIEKAVEGNRIGDISNAIQEYCEKRGYSVVRDLTGHGIGKKCHEDPEVPNYGAPGRGPRLKEGMTVAIEPMAHLGRKETKVLDDDWTVVTKDNTLAAHYEHTIVITSDGYEILTKL